MEKKLSVPDTPGQKPSLQVWRNPNLSKKEILKRNYEFWSKKCEQIARLYEQKNDDYDKVMKEMINVGREYREILAKCRHAEEAYFQIILPGIKLN